MYGLPADTDVSFLVGASLLQVCVGENEVIANLHSDMSLMIASTVRVSNRGGAIEAFADAKSLGAALLPLLGCVIREADGTSDGTLRLVWDDGTIVEIVDSWKEFESYTVRNGEKLIVV
jgi:hypothetical protein